MKKIAIFMLMIAIMVMAVGCVPAMNKDDGSLTLVQPANSREAVAVGFGYHSLALDTVMMAEDMMLITPERRKELVEDIGRALDYLVDAKEAVKTGADAGSTLDLAYDILFEIIRKYEPQVRKTGGN